MEQYIKSFPNSKDYQCGLCEYVSNRPAKVKNHLEAIHFPGIFVYSCDLCGKTFSGKNAFGVHKSQIHGKKSLLFKNQVILYRLSNWRIIMFKHFNKISH